MALSDALIRNIVQKATILQKLGESTKSDFSPDSSALSQLYAITDELNLDRKYVQEAFSEVNGISIHEPIIVDNNDFNSTEVIGFANGVADAALLTELKAQIEYHFNTVGKVVHRPGKIIWKATPSGLSRFIASSNSPEVSFTELNGNTRIHAKQSLKTQNKFYLPALAAAFGAMMVFTVALVESGNDGAPMVIISGLMAFATYLYTRAINRRRNKKKKGLAELTDVLQQIIQRRFNASGSAKGSIVIPDEESDTEDITANSTSNKQIIR